MNIFRSGFSHSSRAVGTKRKTLAPLIREEDNAPRNAEIETSSAPERTKQRAWQKRGMFKAGFAMTPKVGGIKLHTK